MSEISLYDLHAQAKVQLEHGAKFNWILNFECKTAALAGFVMLDVENVAAKWRSKKCPPDLYFTHAQYYGDGVEYIIEDLKRNSSSNRALYSLISQEQIVELGKDDKPIPSFMILQCQIEDDVLYCTCYFRSLEVCNFLKVNLEEIRQTLADIYAGIPHLKIVKLTIFAFRAYYNSSSSSLVRPRLETLSSLSLLRYFTNEVNPLSILSKMLNELKESVTVVSAAPLLSLKEALEAGLKGTELDPKLTSQLTLERLEGAIEAARDLEQLRKKRSHGTAIADATLIYQKSIDNLISNLNA
ncbi:hypothetical protein [Janthinobacterium sp. B9-8]|uniref:hypothetical protein n=1 Tax=Janthinobacterium sp. B9-8 TaxID=1236179 RepID=UPI00061CF359|nr:hypothetical protein [Janthinobacterium sp. B9-8]AMC35406.1 hypothetical protein VN23_12675 [Janthinobacterium sp. B9-8]